MVVEIRFFAGHASVSVTFAASVATFYVSKKIVMYYFGVATLSTELATLEAPHTRKYCGHPDAPKFLTKGTPVVPDTALPTSDEIAPCITLNNGN